MPKTCENWLGPVNSCIYYACQTREIYQVLITVKLKSNLYVGPVNIFSNFWHCVYDNQHDSGQGFCITEG